MHFPNETPAYREARDRLTKLEIQARRAVETAARARRELPLGGELPENFIFQECDAGGNVRDVRFSELFTPPSPTLVTYSYMYGPGRKEPCPMCTGILDALDGVVQHIRQRAAFVVVAQSNPKRLFDWARARGWDLRVVSAAGNRFNELYVPGASADGDAPMANVFTRRDGRLYHTYAVEMGRGTADPGQDERGLDLLNPIFGFLDLTPEGRGNFYTSLHYPETPPAPDRTRDGAPIPDSARPN